MAKDVDNAFVYGDDASGVWFAPKGTTGPTDLTNTALITPWVEAGWLGDNGIDQDNSTDKKELTAYQGGVVLRTKTTKTVRTFKFQCLEETALTLGLMYPGSTPTTTTGTTKIVVPAGTPTDRRAMVVDVLDGTTHKRYVCTDAEVSDRATLAHKTDEFTVYEFTVTAYGGFTIYTNNAAAATS